MVIDMNAKIVLAVLSLLVLIAACAPKERAPAPVVIASDADVSSIETTNAQLDELDKEMDTTSMDKLDQDLASIDNLDLG